MKVDNEKYIRSLVGHIPMHRPVAVLIIFKDNKVYINDSGFLYDCTITSIFSITTPLFYIFI